MTHMSYVGAILYSWPPHRGIKITTIIISVTIASNNEVLTQLEFNCRTICTGIQYAIPYAKLNFDYKFVA
jgi:hypothetical protein